MSMEVNGNGTLLKQEKERRNERTVGFTINPSDFHKSVYDEWDSLNDSPHLCQPGIGQSGTPAILDRVINRRTESTLSGRD